MPTDAPPPPLEPDAAAMRAWVEAALERVIEHIESLPDQPAWSEAGGAEKARALRETLPEDGGALDGLLDTVFDAAHPSFNTASPGYFAFIPGGGLFASAVADFVANAINRYAGLWRAAPALVQLEQNAVTWFCEMVGYGPGAGGFLTSGGSLANLSAVITARRERLPEDFLAGTLYTSTEAHHSVAKAAVLAGFPEARVRAIPADARFRLRVDALREAIAADRAAGLQPFLVVANGGSTNTGAVDPLPELADLAESEGLWLHVDAAYGGFFALTERGRRALRGLERADSITLDPHKSLFLPLGTGCLLAREREALRRGHHGGSGAYLPSDRGDADEFWDFCEHSPELSRDFRGLRVWLPLKLHGAAAFRAALDEKLDLTGRIVAELRKRPDLELAGPPALSLLAFRLHPPGVDDEQELETLNRALWERINESQRVFVTPTVAGGRFWIRICVLHLRTHAEQVEACLAEIRDALAAVR